jgi:beta-lactamase regulating signal transducer with metallopeptidase domain
MADFLLFLGKLNLAMGAAILLVWLLRRPLRAPFGAPIAYALWLLVPIAGLAILMPPRTEAPPPVPVVQLQSPAVRNLPVPYPAAQMPVTVPVAQAAPRVPAQQTEHAAPVRSMIAVQTASLDAAFFDYAALVFLAWVLGAVLMALYLARLQLRFHATMRLGEAGPAVLGFFHPRVVVPDGFQEQFTAAEQAAILAHERVHLARQDARINALAALLRCLCWFNPLVHLGVAWLRIDQELACDATALTRAVSRRDYANALLKSQMMMTALPLGCNWPGSQHPLIERIALLKRKRPGMARRMTGAGLVIIAAACVGLSARAAQPPVPAKSIAAPSINKQIALAVPPVRTSANQNAGNISNPPVSDANPIAGDAAKNIPVTKPAARLRANAPVPDSGSVEAQSPPILDNLPEQKIDLALNAAADTALAKAAADASSTLSNRTVAQQMAANGTTPKPANSDPFAGVGTLVNGKCQPISDLGGHTTLLIIGTVAGVHTDPARFGTDIVLDHIWPTPEVSALIKDGTALVFARSGIHTVSGKPLDTVVGRNVAIWTFTTGGGFLRTVASVRLLCDPSQVHKETDLLPNDASAPAAAVALNAPPAAPFQSVSPVAAVTLNDQPVAPTQAATPGPSAGPIAATTPASAFSAGLSLAAGVQSGNAPRPQTEAALKCLNGLGPDGCETLFENSVLAHRAIRYCAAEYVHDRLGNCPAGALEALEYLGANAAGDDVFLTKNLDENDTYIIPPPGPDGKVARWCTSGRPPESTFQPFCSDRRRVDSSVVRVTTRPDHTLILYTGPQDHAALQSTRPDGAFVPAAAIPNDQPGMQPTTPDAPAGPVQVAAVTPASASSDSCSGMGNLVNGKCQPITPRIPDRWDISASNYPDYPVIGTLVAVQPDPARAATKEIVLDHILPTPGVSSLIRDGRIIIDYAQGPPANAPGPLAKYVGQEVAVWNIRGLGIDNGKGPVRVLPVCHPSQVQRQQSAAETIPRAADAATTGVTGAATETSQALQEPLDQPIAYVSVGERISLRGEVRPEIAQPLQQAVQLAKATHPDPAAIIEKFNQAAAVPNLNRDEENTLGRARTILFGAKPSNNGTWFSPFGPYAAQPPKMSSYLPPGDVGPNTPD